ncbi:MULTISPECIES: NAD(P)-dependent oxidoreductase [unclassified Exiguobacterium]|uniref:NAD(P)-dependent oxidoreductase n=1 Tax=unclassified Exiguobacterium TaxID=2644629 RepID=UPI00103FD4C3|nr:MULTISPECIES: NAD(P)-dependent oxidoreductase [unclassified Exiguobacterium]TCI39765.1 NAD(P)-dependent oxidoreductase [Exiguobacterium sp. SH4S7]TCI47542.1 NAD(P)-dependent oxidoreductase [Exiguobacterium sp. SH5S32]TCI54426.1 NAD(P)-dependent oxidoreductase [Exiguobacterium sp. SH1S4]TCI74219.1 NAD(P)-dependent oxidoreductase [Exiguobacterium sp. SH1S1]
MKTIGFIGLGVMGQSMVRNLMKAGYTVQAYTRTKDKAADLLAEGVTWCDSIEAACQNADAVITIVGYPSDVESIYFGKGMILDSAEPGTLVIDMTTSSPKLAERIAEAAIDRSLLPLDAPVTGGDVGAKDGTLSILVGGGEFAFTKAMPLFEAMGQAIERMGYAGSGQYAKLANQIAIAGIMMGNAELLAFTKRAGLDPDQLRQTIRGGAAGSWTLENLVPRMIVADYSPGFFIKHFIKDMALALESAQELGVKLPSLELAYRLYSILEENGYGENGTQALIEYYMHQDV